MLPGPAEESANRLSGAQPPRRPDQRALPCCTSVVMKYVHHTPWRGAWQGL